MAEPNTSGASITMLLVGALGPLAGQYALIVMAALAGALWPLSTMDGTTKLKGAFFLARIVFTAIMLTGTVAWFLETHFNLPAYEGMAIASFGIGALGNGWGGIFRALRDGIAGFLRAFGSKGSGYDGGRGNDQ